MPRAVGSHKLLAFELGAAVDAQRAGRVVFLPGLIAAAVEEQSTATGEIGRAISEATVGSTSVSTSIGAVAEAASATAAGADASHRAAAGIVVVSEDLSAAISRFTYE